MEKLPKEIEDSYLEWAIEEVFVNELEDAGWVTIKGDKIKRGFADRFCFGPRATTIVIEFKRLRAPAKRRGEKLQNHYRKQLSDLGFDTRKSIGWNAACDLLKELLGRYGRGDL